ncbi:MAG TPA: hypothetical protein VIE43_25150 [Thermoanaerobaculia bacterium]|jgi:hypothetical protein|nr:hypothetical protein [Thermoanaerobaculia bacterium]
MSRRPRKPSRFDLIPPGASFEDDVHLDELRQPWSLTFGEFLRLVRERYGFTYRERTAGGMELAYFESADGEIFAYPPDAMSLTDQLDAGTTTLLCTQMGIPPEDFGLPSADEP